MAVQPHIIDCAWHGHPARGVLHHGLEADATKRRRKGVLTLELVLAMPILLAVILVLVEIGTYLLAVQSIQGAAMVGAREASLPSATPDRVQAAVVGALSGWSYANSLQASDIVITNDVPVPGSVTVAVSIDATAAVVNPLSMVPGFDLSGSTISAQFVMRRE